MIIEGILGTVLVTVVGFEQVSVGAGTFDNCVRLTVEDEEARQPTMTYWLAPGIGLGHRRCQCQQPCSS